MPRPAAASALSLWWPAACGLPLEAWISRYTQQGCSDGLSSADWALRMKLRDDKTMTWQEPGCQENSGDNIDRSGQWARLGPVDGVTKLRVEWSGEEDDVATAWRCSQDGTDDCKGSGACDQDITPGSAGVFECGNSNHRVYVTWRHVTWAPTGVPSAVPSVQPSRRPSLSPSLAPTARPSSPPSRAPSPGPSAAPSSGAPSVSPTTRPSAAPTVPPSRPPTPHPCDDGSHGCHNLSSSGICTRVGTDDWACSCDKHYWCAANCGPKQAHQCTLITGAPTAAPSHRPSPGPTGAPTVTPSTGAPSAHPSPGPTAAPSQRPTQSPSDSPSAAPSTAPSPVPTAPPSAAPTRHPSAAPSAGPSRRPSPAPTAGPSTAAPSAAPSADPSRGPSVPPSLSPTSSPTAPPTAAPSQEPTGTPSARPSAGPSALPSAGPSPAPSRAPTASPRLSPPTTAPTATPTTAPTTAPTATPTTSPNAPTAAPTTSPNAPTAPPSPAPTSAPSAAPRAPPSTAPTAGPVAAPTASPSQAPTPQPTQAAAAVAVAQGTADAGAAAAILAVSAPAAAQGGRMAVLTAGCTEGGVRDEVPFTLHPSRLQLPGHALPMHAGAVVGNLGIALAAALLHFAATLAFRRLKGTSTVEAQGALRFPSGPVLILVILSQGVAYCGARLARHHAGIGDFVIGLSGMVVSAFLPIAVLREGRLSQGEAVYKLDPAARTGWNARWLGTGEWLSVSLSGLECTHRVERWGVTFRAALPQRYHVLALDILLTQAVAVSAGLGGGTCGSCAGMRIGDVLASLILIAAVCRGGQPYSRPIRLPLTVLAQLLLAIGAAILAVGYLSPSCGGTEMVAGYFIAAGGLATLLIVGLDLSAVLRSVQLQRRDQLNKVLQRFEAMDTDGTGQLSRGELAAGLSAVYGTHIPEEEFDKLFAQVDKDGSGAVDLHEFLECEHLFWDAGCAGASPTGKDYAPLPFSNRPRWKGGPVQAMQPMSPPLIPAPVTPRRRGSAEGSPRRRRRHRTGVDASPKSFRIRHPREPPRRQGTMTSSLELSVGLGGSTLLDDGTVRPLGECPSPSMQLMASSTSSIPVPAGLLTLGGSLQPRRGSQWRLLRSPRFAARRSGGLDAGGGDTGGGLPQSPSFQRLRRAFPGRCDSARHLGDGAAEHSVGHSPRRGHRQQDKWGEIAPPRRATSGAL